MEINKIYNMDCIEGMKLLPDNSVDLIILDPPYNTGMDSVLKRTDANARLGQKARLSGFFDDNLTPETYEALMFGAFTECYRVLKMDKPMYVFIDHRNVDKLKQWLIRVGFNYKQILIWDKVIHGLNYQNYAYQYEMIIYVTKGDYHHKQINYKKDIIRCKRVNSDNKLDHETVKPVELIAKLIQDNSDKGDLVLDCFAGTGTLACACLQMQRQFICFEISQNYINIALKRIEGWQQQKRLK